MTVQMIRGPQVTMPAGSARKNRLLDVAMVHEGAALLDPVEGPVTWNCHEAAVSDVCGGDPKTFLSPSTAPGMTTVLYVGSKCRLVGMTLQEITDNTSTTFDLSESKALEAEFETQMLATGGDVGALTSITGAVASIEGQIAGVYNGEPVIHMSPYTATFAAAANLFDDNSTDLRTKVGSRVVVGAGYSDNAVWGSGQIVVHRSPKELVEGFNTSNNDEVVLAERLYVVYVDCILLKSSITLTP